MNTDEWKQVLRKELDKARKVEKTEIILTEKEWRDIQKKANPHSFCNLKLRWKKWKEWKRWNQYGKIKQWLILFGIVHDYWFENFRF